MFVSHPIAAIDPIVCNLGSPSETASSAPLRQPGMADNPVDQPPVLAGRFGGFGQAVVGLAAAEHRASDGKQRGITHRGHALLTRPPPGTAMGLVPATILARRALPKA